MTSSAAVLWWLKKADKVVVIYRVEDKTGLGPYHGGSDFSHNLKVEHGDVSRDSHPTPWDDRMYDKRFPDSLIFGFDNLRKARKWFRGHWRNLRKHGYELVTYEVQPRYVHRGASGLQIAFHSKKGKKIHVRGGQHKARKLVIDAL